MNVKVDGKSVVVKNDITYYELSKMFESENRKIYLAKVGHDIRELRRNAKEGENVEFLTFDNDFVKKAYARTATLMMLKAINDAFGDVKAYLKFRIQNSYYFEIEGKEISDNDTKLIQEKFAKMVEEEIVIKKISYPRGTALKIIEENKMEDVALLFKYSYKPIIKLRYIDNFVGYMNDELLYHTGYIKYYEINRYKTGILLTTSSSDDEKEMKKNIEEKVFGGKQFDTLNESTNWAKKLKINTVGKLNESIANDKFDNLVIMTESYQDKQIGNIADAVKESNKKIVFIAGPSSSGKTSFSHRLAYHLIALDIKPHLISCDNFFKNREDSPIDENGEYNFEIIEAMELDLLNSTLKRLKKGEEVEMPIFNFKTGKREYRGDKLKLYENDVVILEGIHCLNPKIAPDISYDDAFKIYVSALTEVCIDNANRIATSDLRLIRRLIRDMHSRKRSAKEILHSWKSVIKGEITSIYPYQENADIFFNSALIYEFSVIKDKALPKLYQIADDEQVGITARRLIKILNFFLSVDTEAIPMYSIIREFLGNSILEVA